MHVWPSLPCVNFTKKPHLPLLDPLIKLLLIIHVGCFVFQKTSIIMYYQVGWVTPTALHVSYDWQACVNNADHSILTELQPRSSSGLLCWWMLFSCIQCSIWWKRKQLLLSPKLCFIVHLSAFSIHLQLLLPAMKSCLVCLSVTPHGSCLGSFIAPSLFRPCTRTLLLILSILLFLRPQSFGKMWTRGEKKHSFALKNWKIVGLFFLFGISLFADRIAAHCSDKSSELPSPALIRPSVFHLYKQVRSVRGNMHCCLGGKHS